MSGKRRMLKRAAWTALAAAALMAGAGQSAYGAETKASASIAYFEPKSLVKKDGTLWEWGNRYQPAPVRVPGVENAAYTVGGSFIVRQDQSVLYLNRKETRSGAGYQAIELPGLSGLAKALPWGDGYALLDQSGRLHIVDADGEVPVPASLKKVDGMEDAAAISTYWQTKPVVNKLLVLRKDGSLWTGDGKRLERFSEVKLSVPAVRIADHMALGDDGTLWTMPMEPEAQPLPKKAKIAAPVADIYSDGRTRMAVDAQGRIWFLGGTVTGISEGTVYHPSDKPVMLETIVNVKRAFVVERMLLAWTREGNLYAASIDHEQMPSDPEFRLLAKDVVQLEPARRHLIMEKRDGSLWGWGVNKFGELGSGDFAYMHDKPVRMQRPVSVWLNGEEAELPSGVIIVNGQAFVPLRSVFDRMGAEVRWDGASRTVTIKHERKDGTATVMAFHFETGAATLNGREIELPNKPFIRFETSYLPLRIISENMGAKVEWQPKDNRIAIELQ